MCTEKDKLIFSLMHPRSHLFCLKKLLVLGSYDGNDFQFLGVNKAKDAWCIWIQSPPPLHPKSSGSEYESISEHYMSTSWFLPLSMCQSLYLLFLPPFKSFPILFLQGTKGSIAGHLSSRKDLNVFRKPMMPQPYPMCHEPIVVLHSSSQGNLLLGPTWADLWAAGSNSV